MLLLNVNDLTSERVSRLIFESGEPKKTVAEAIGVSPQLLANKLHGKTVFTVAQLSALADHFAVSTDWLLGREEVQQ